MPQVENAEQVKALIKKVGLDFRYADNEKTMLQAMTDRSKNVAYYVDILKLPMIVRRRCTGDVMGVHAVVKIGANCKNVCFGSTSHACLHLFLTTDADEAVCDLCNDETRRGMAHLGGACVGCGYRMCQFCCLKLVLDDVSVSILLNFGQPPDSVKCPQCRQSTTLNIWHMYYKAMKHPEELSTSQQQALAFLSERDPDFGRKMEEREHRLKLSHQRRTETRNQQFKQGASVQIQGLIHKSEWNGLRAVVIGKVINKNGASRYPVKLQHSKGSALIKKRNLRLVE